MPAPCWTRLSGISMTGGIFTSRWSTFTEPPPSRSTNDLRYVHALPPDAPAVTRRRLGVSVDRAPRFLAGAGASGSRGGRASVAFRGTDRERADGHTSFSRIGSRDFWRSNGWLPSRGRPLQHRHRSIPGSDPYRQNGPVDPGDREPQWHDYRRLGPLRGAYRKRRRRRPRTQHLSGSGRREPERRRGRIRLSESRRSDQRGG